MLLSKGEKGRAKLRQLMDHHIVMNSACCKTLAESEKTAGKIKTYLSRYGFKDECYVISSDPTTDGCFLKTEEAIARFVEAYDGMFVSIVPGKIGLFTLEGRNGAFFCEKIDEN